MILEQYAYPYFTPTLLASMHTVVALSELLARHSTYKSSTVRPRSPHSSVLLSRQSSVNHRTTVGTTRQPNPFSGWPNAFRTKCGIEHVGNVHDVYKYGINNLVVNRDILPTS